MTADEARALWPDVLAAVPAAWNDVVQMVRIPPVDLVPMIQSRYMAGCDEFRGDWTGRDAAWCTSNAMEELADLVTYHAFRRVLSARSAVK